LNQDRKWAFIGYKFGIKGYMILDIKTKQFL